MSAEADVLCGPDTANARLTGLTVATGIDTGISTPARGPSMSRFLSCARVEACWRTELLGPKVHRSKRHGDVSALCDRGVVGTGGVSAPSVIGSEGQREVSRGGNGESPLLSPPGFRAGLFRSGFS
jgi:hypothetical protein